ncbi:MAG: DUF5702 domain-containing protein [Lachnospiraceae bacterium]|nr:DUF5702 domain-containing protein [Lachnospiraceae bacterium]
MFSKQDYQKGALSVYYAMMLAVMIPLIFTMMEGARVNAMKMRMECAVDLAMDSALAEYNRELFKQYDLLFIDTAYDKGRGSLDNTIAHMEDYLSYNLETDKEVIFIGDHSDLLGLRSDDIEFTRVSRATDGGGEVFRYMVLSYMLEKYGLAYIEDAKDLAGVSETSGLFSGDIEEEEAEAQQELDDYEFEVPQVDDGNGGKMDDPDWEEPEKEDPAANVNQIRNTGILGLVCSDEISQQSIDPQKYAMQRDLVAGDGMCEGWDERKGTDYELMFNEYIMDKCGNYRSPKEGSLLRYETEYIISGKDNDVDNLKAVVHRLLLIRGTANSIYFFTDVELMSEAATLASSLAALSATPELEPIYKALIIAAWIYAESMNDLKEIMGGGRVPLLKKTGEWKLSIENALGLTAGDIEGSKGEVRDTADTGLDYGQYLRLLLFVTSKEDRVGRLMNVVEMDLRKAGYENFKLDECIAAATVQFTFHSTYGYDFFMERSFGYE